MIREKSGTLRLVVSERHLLMVTVGIGEEAVS